MKRRGLTRRRMLAGAGAAALTACGLDRAVPRSRDVALVRDPDGLVDLPEGFSYRVLQRSGQIMSDGHLVPGRPDGMACFDGGDDTWVLLRNHELWEAHLALSPWREGEEPLPEAYDPAAPGAVTRVVLDARSGELSSSNLVLCGTYWNCAGGISPWGWLSCEETVQEGHGYVFSCATEASRARAPERIDGYGRFRHEAAAVDARTSIAYLTEDQLDASFYRFVPDEAQKPFAGRLQALMVEGRPGLDIGLQSAGRRFDIAWVEIADPTPETDTVRIQAQDLGAARFQRTEGLWLGDDDAFISASSGGREGHGQILKLDLRAQTLEVLASSADERVLDMPDNLCLSPDGLLFVAEDGIDLDNRLRVLDADGALYSFAHARKPTEFAGPCFAPDGRTLFVNLQALGLTLAIAGPFEEVLERVLPASRGAAAAQIRDRASVTDGVAALAARTWLHRAQSRHKRRG